MKLTSAMIAIIVVVVFIAGIGLTAITGIWQTESSKIPATYTSGEYKGEYNPADIRGSYTFGDIAEVFSVPVDILTGAFGIKDTKDPGSFQCKLLEEIYGEVDGGEIGTDAVRLFVALYTGLPYTPEETTRLLSQAVPYLENRVDGDKLAEVRAVTVDVTGTTVTETLSTETVPETTEKEHDGEDAYATDEDREVKGKTTFKELLDWGVKQEKIENILGYPIAQTGIAVRDFCIEKGVEFSLVKTELQTLVDSSE